MILENYMLNLPSYAYEGSFNLINEINLINFQSLGDVFVVAYFPKWHKSRNAYT